MGAPIVAQLEEFQTLERHAGLDEYEVRTWRGWHHNVTLALLAGARSCWISSGGWGKSRASAGGEPVRVAR